MPETFEREDSAGIRWRVTINRTKGTVTEERITPRPSRNLRRSHEDDRRVLPLSSIEPTTGLDADGLAVLRELRTRRPPHREGALRIAQDIPSTQSQRIAAVETYLRHYV